MAYSELIKNFDNIRSYMHEFFIYGFKTRVEYDKKSSRSYDNERRRIQSYLGDFVSFKQDASGKKLFISIDGRSITHNPLYKAFKSKSFTNKDITLHFIIQDILFDGEEYTLKEMIEIIDKNYLFKFDNPLSFDESTLRKKLTEYKELGLITQKRYGRAVKYKISENKIVPKNYQDAIRFFSEESPLGVIGSYLEDKICNKNEYLTFKNHYIMNAYDAEITEAILKGINEKRRIDFSNFSNRYKQEKKWSVIPLKLYISTQGGRNYLICIGVKNNKFMSFRIDYIKNVRIGERCREFDDYIEKFKESSKNMWGVSHGRDKAIEHIEMDIHVGEKEEFIIRRLNREKRCGTITKIDNETYRFAADVFDAYELVPWIRTFFGRIKKLKCSNDEVINQIKLDIINMKKQYEVGL